MSTFFLILFGLIVIGAIIQKGILYSLAIGFDFMCQDIFFDDTLGVTISSRCGLAAINGNPTPAKIVNFIMLSDTHCQDAITNDIARAKAVLALLDTK